MLDAEHVRAFLRDAGYAVHEREAGWHECLLVHEAERWHGSGGTADEALLDAVTKAFPSRAALRLLIAALEPLPTQAVMDAAPREAEAIDDAKVTPPSPEPPIDAIPAIVDEPVAPPATATVPAPAPVPRREIPRRRSPRMALAELAVLRETMTADSDELGQCSPRRQRVVMNGWIAAARTIQDEFDDDDAVVSAVRGIAGMLTRFSKTWWPGRIAGLGLFATPSDAARDLVGDQRSDAANWTDVALIADEMLVAIESEDTRRGRDDYGWADGRECEPAPDAPDPMLAEIAQELEARGGVLGIEPTGLERPHPDELLHWVRKLRWLRPHVTDGARWAAAIGRCRCWASKARDEFAEGDAALQPEFKPATAWSSVLGITTRPKPVLREPVPELPSLPSADDTVSDAQLTDWLGAALPHAGERHAEIVEVMRPYTERVLKIEPGSIPGESRHVRKRLSKLKASLGKGSDVRPAAPVRSQPVESPAEPSESVDQVRLAVSAKTRRKVALVVTNRDDGALGKRLEETLAFARVDVIKADPRRIDAAVDAVVSKRYDFVLGATGFMHHSTDAAFKTACDRAGVTYVRVVKGRPSTCVRALARHFGMDHEQRE